MKIAQVICQVLRVRADEKTTAGAQAIALARVRADNGLEGIGETDAAPEAVRAIIDAPAGLRELLLGEDPLETGRLWQKMRAGTQSFGRGGLAVAAMSAVDMALWDLKGRHFNEPIHRLLGGKHHEQLKACASAQFGQDGDETQMLGRRWLRAGYQAVQFVGSPLGQSPELDVELVRGARAGLGDTVMLMIDAGGAWDARTALGRAQGFAQFNVTWLENPVRSDDLDGCAWLRDRSPVPIAGGGMECGREALRPWMDHRALDVFQVDLGRCGFTDAAYLRARVEEIGARPGSHCHPSPISVAAGLHWLSTCRDAVVFEDCADDSPLRHELIRERLEAENGWIKVPDQPGLGVTLNEEFVRKYLVAESGG